MFWQISSLYIYISINKTKTSFLSQKRAITTFLSRKFMITRLLIAFEDFLGSSIAPQVMPPCPMPIGIPKYFTFRQLWILLSTGKEAYLSHIYIHVHVFTFVHPAYMTYSGSCGWPSCRALQESGNERRVLRLILAHLHHHQNMCKQHTQTVLHIDGAIWLGGRDGAAWCWEASAPASPSLL